MDPRPRAGAQALDLLPRGFRVRYTCTPSGRARELRLNSMHALFYVISQDPPPPRAPPPPRTPSGRGNYM
jgi:hypothetical protein